MIRDVYALSCVYPADSKTTFVEVYTLRYHKGKRDPGFIKKAGNVFAGIEFMYKNYCQNSGKVKWKK
jgi:hypothetical protein